MKKEAGKNHLPAAPESLQYIEREPWLKQVIVLHGREGSGKSTLADAFKMKGMPIINTGEEVRHTVASSRTEPYVLEAKRITDEGKFMPASILRQILLPKLLPQENRDGVVLDGAMRTAEQAQDFPQLLEEAHLDFLPVIMVLLNTGLETCLDRLYNRSKKDPVRTDDIPTKIQERFINYDENIDFIKEFMQKNYTLIEVNGERPKAQRVKETMTKLKENWKMRENQIFP